MAINKINPTATGTGSIADQLSNALSNSNAAPAVNAGIAANAAPVNTAPTNSAHVTGYAAPSMGVPENTPGTFTTNVVSGNIALGGHGRTKDSPTFNWATLGSNSRFNVSNNPGDTVLNEVHLEMTKLVEIINEQKQTGLQLNLVAMNRADNPDLSMSSLVLIGREMNAPETAPVAYVTFLLSKSAGELRVTRQNVNGNVIDAVRTPAETWTQGAKNVIKERVQKLFPRVHPAHVLDAGDMEIGILFDPKNEPKMKAQFNMGLLALVRQLEMVDPGSAVLQLRNDLKESTLTVGLQFHNHEIVETPDGMPIRADVVISMDAQMKMANVNYNDPYINPNERVLNTNPTTPYSKLYGYIEPMFVGEDTTMSSLGNFAGMNEQQRQMLMVQMAPLAKTRIWQPTFIITGAWLSKTYEPNAVIMALTSAMALLKGDNFVLGLKPDYSAGQPMHDVGYLGLEIPGTEAYIKTQPSEFGHADLLNLHNMVCRPGLAMAIDVPVIGSDSWFLRNFAEAAAGDDKSHQSAAAITERINELTNGEFKQLLASDAYRDVGGPMLPSRTVMWSGYYTDSSGHRRDPRDIDVLSLYGETSNKDPQIVRRWMASFHQSKDPILAAHERLGIIQSVRPNFVPTGRYFRCVLNPRYWDVVLQAINKCGLSVQVPTLMQNVDTGLHMASNLVQNAAIVTQPAFMNAGFAGGNVAPSGWISGLWGVR